MSSNTPWGESDEDGDDEGRFVHTENLMTPSSKAETRRQPIVIRHEREPSLIRAAAAAAMDRFQMWQS